MSNFDEQQARTDAICLAIEMSKVGANINTIINRAQRIYGFIANNKADLIDIRNKQVNKKPKS